MGSRREKFFTLHYASHKENLLPFLNGPVSISSTCRYCCGDTEYEVIIECHLLLLKASLLVFLQAKFLILE